MAEEFEAQYPQYTQEKEAEGAKTYDWYNKWYQAFNPKSPVAKTPTSAPFFNEAAQRTGDYTNKLRGTGGGSVDFGALARNLGDKSALQTRTVDVGSLMDDIRENTARARQMGASQFGRLGQIGDTTTAMSRLPESRYSRRLQDQDLIESMYKAYEAGMDPFENALARGAGDFGGTVLGKKLFKPKEMDPFGLPALPADERDYMLPEPPIL